MDLSPEEARELNERLDREWDVDRRLHLVFGVLYPRRARPRPPPPPGADDDRRNGGLCRPYRARRWSPPKALMQRLGVRTRKQIERERYVTIFGKEPPFLED